MTIKFDSNEWTKELSRQINESKDCERSAKYWEGDFISMVEPDDSFRGRVFLYLGLLHGKSPDAAKESITCCSKMPTDSGEQTQK